MNYRLKERKTLPFKNTFTVDNAVNRITFNFLSKQIGSFLPEKQSSQFLILNHTVKNCETQYCVILCN